ncbi:hypothetical protein EEB18_012715 [Sphingopyxis sp. OPL5]|uniref:hypothetical protein n=1 Tax=Sphingopyxis sp. OPL5 TaxID=2486273 RepID=UPI00164D08B1|nr:hypothetical protein [Sphingopyxis sp. OPL5]QNO25659.1 hypothetical protein EEB18_012715 [Sphingopyxis sp. OPL5]
MFHLLAATQAAAVAAPPAVPPAAVAAPVAMPAQSISPADVAAYIDPRDIASFMPPPPPTTEFVAVSDSFFRLMENITMVALFVIGFFLLARLIHAWMLHRSIRRALEAKSDAVAPLIDKLNKPYEHLGAPNGAAATPNGGDDRNALVLLAIGLAMAGFGLIQGHEELIRISAGAALFPAFVGIALLVRRRLARAAAAEERAAAQG